MQSKSQVLKKLAKKLPDGAVYTLNEQEGIEFIPTGISTLDYAIGGGWPRGWMTQVYGPSSSGKSAMVLQSIGNYQKNHPESLAAVIDLEKSMTEDWAVKFGIDPDRLVVLRPTNVEEMITMSVEAVKANAFDIIMVDSLGAGLLQSEIENDRNRVAGSAGAITRMVKSINAAFIELERMKKLENDSSTEDESDYIVPAVLLINQVRVNMSSMYGEDTYGGGKALGHMLGVNIHLRASKASADKIMGTVDGQQLRVGWMCTATVEKNKLSVPGKSAGYSFVFCECPEHEFGIDNARSVADLALATGIARVDGKSIYYPTPSGTEEKVVGRNNFQQIMRENEELVKFLAEEISRDISKNSCDEDAITVQNMD